MRRAALAKAVCSVVALALVGACSRPAATAGPGPPIPTAPERTTTTNPYAVPATIDAAYVNRVLAGLDAAFGDTMRLVVKNRAVTAEAEDRLKALYTDSVRSSLVIALAEEIRDGFPAMRPSPGDQRTTVTRLITAEPGCIFAQVDRDLSLVATRVDPADASQWVGLVSVDPTRNSSGINPTPWQYAYEGFPSNHSQPKNPCAPS